MAGLCEGGNEPSGSLKAISHEGPRPAGRLLASRPDAEAEVDDHPTSTECITILVNCPKTGLNLTSDTKEAPLMRQLDQEIMG
ncbi:hypothetical protein ANN_02151 [Periplaneta americana]|uniref:Uncharacterized protein n=1 Tax=Periplaneta americana TaxID=6978 RepID=A0ABQ8TXY1_PERAM|nr:hypothetical protein ANN_02151 [Periplaneta americana]